MIIKKTAFAFLLAGVVTFGGCAAPSAPQSSAGSSPQTSSSEPAPEKSASSKPEASEPVVPDFSPEQAKAYLEQAKTQSLLVTVDKNGKTVATLPFLGAGYSGGMLSPDKTHLLCKSDEQSGGEARSADYVSIDLKSGTVYPSPNRQSGVSEHIFLDNDIIGFANGSVIGGEEETWKPIQLYDSRYKPLGVTLAFDYGKELTTKGGSTYFENSLTGIGYDRVNRRYLVTFAKELSPEGSPTDQPHKTNRQGIAIFSGDGTLLESKLLPEEYMAPYSDNVLSLYSNNPQMLNDGWALVGTMKELNLSYLLLVNLETWEMKELAYSDSQIRLSDDLRYLCAVEDFRAVEEEPKMVLLKLQGGGATLVKEIPRSFAAEGRQEEFYFSDILIGGEVSYLTATVKYNDNLDLTGLFRMDNSGIHLIHQLPPVSFFQLVGMDDSGNCQFLIFGATEQLQEYLDSALNELNTK